MPTDSKPMRSTETVSRTLNGGCDVVDPPALKLTSFVLWHILYVLTITPRSWFTFRNGYESRNKWNVLNFPGCRNSSWISGRTTTGGIITLHPSVTLFRVNSTPSWIAKCWFGAFFIFSQIFGFLAYIFQFL